MQEKTITIFNKTIRQDADGRFCLNDLHKAAMANSQATESQRPGAFLQSDSVKGFISAVDDNAIIVAIKKSAGRNGGTYATELVALRYAGWISPKVEIEVYKTFQKVANADEGLTHDLIERQQDPEAQRRLATRAQSKVSRLAYTDTLKQHGVNGIGYALCTNAIYKPLFGAGASDFRKSKGLAKKANVRECMSSMELAATMFAEEVAADRIRKAEAHGNEQCQKHSENAAKETRRVLDNTGME